MPVIRVSEEVNRLIRKRGRYGETQDDVLRKLLQMKPKATSAKTKASGKKPPLSDTHRKLIMKILLQSAGHRAIASQTVAQLQKHIKALSATRAQEKRIQQRSAKLTKEARHGLLHDKMLIRVRDKGRVFWQLTDKGIRRAKQLRAAAVKRRARRKTNDAGAKNRKNKGNRADTVRQKSE